jgi:hypothetical protein
MGNMTHIRRERAEFLDRVAPTTPAPTVAAPLGPTVALTVTLLAGCFTLLAAAVNVLVHPRPLPPPYNLGARQDLETALFLASFGVLLPAALAAAPRIADAISARASSHALSFVTALISAGLPAAVLAARALTGGGVAPVLAAVALWGVGTVALLAWAARRLPRGAPLRAEGMVPVAWTLAGALWLASLLAFTSLKSISVPALALGALLAIAVLALQKRRVAGTPWPSRGRWRHLIDVAALAVVLLAIPDLVIFDSPAGTSAFGWAVHIGVLQLHQNFVLGPANVVLHGGAMLVDTASQYGVGSIYFLAGWFQIAPIGYGTLGLLDGALFALVFAAGYCVLRMARVSRTLAGAALVLAIVVLIYNLQYSVGSLPAQHGPLRFGLPMLLVATMVAAARWPARRSLGAVAPLLVVALASIWAFEACAYTLGTFAAMTCFEAAARPRGSRRRWLAGRAAGALGACLLAHALLVGLTLAVRGALPDYGWYGAFLGSFAFGKVGAVTYDFSRWSAALPVGIAYAASAAAFVLVVRRRPGLVARERTALTALCGLTVYGIALFSYFVDRSADHILPYVSLPALLAGALWLSLVTRGALDFSRRARLGAVALALGLSVLLTAVAFSSIGERFRRSALGHMMPGGASTARAVAHLWHLPPLNRGAPTGDELLNEYMPGRRVLSLVAPDLEAEILIRGGRTLSLPLTYPAEDSFASAHYLPGLRRAIAALRPGERLLTQDVGLRAFAILQHQPARDPLTRPVAPKQLASLQEWVLQRIGQRFDLRVLHRRGGFVVAALEPRR